MHERLSHLGFRCVSTPAIRGVGKGTIGGVAIVAPKHIGLTSLPWLATDVHLLQGRAVRAHVGGLIKG
eukprot:3075682-Amphidinium_carterae.2